MLVPRQWDESQSSQYWAGCEDRGWQEDRWPLITVTGDVSATSDNTVHQDSPNTYNFIPTFVKKKAYYVI